MSSATESKPRCFVVSPIGEKGDEIRGHADKVLRHVIRGALEPEYSVHRADDDSNPGAITPQIISSIMGADLIVADISGANANVFYELAIAHGYDKPTVHLQSTGQRVPFDIKDMRVISYDIQDLDSVEEAKRALRQSAKFAFANPTRIETPLKGAENFKAVASSTDPNAQLLTQILEEIAELRKQTSPSRRAMPSRNTAAQFRADIAELKRILSRVGKAGRLEPEDLVGVITPSTSSDFDNWARRALAAISGRTDENDLNEVLFDEAVKLGEPEGEVTQNN